jgi:hypothetical protein
MSAVGEALERARDTLPEDGEWSPEHERAEDEIIALQRLQRMLAAHPPAQVITALAIAQRILRECTSPAKAIERLLVWRRERMWQQADPTEAELGALSVAATIAGVEP